MSPGGEVCHYSPGHIVHLGKVACMYVCCNNFDSLTQNAFHNYHFVFVRVFARYLCTSTTHCPERPIAQALTYKNLLLALSAMTGLTMAKH